jgi:hypothetical protein
MFLLVAAKTDPPRAREILSTALKKSQRASRRRLLFRRKSLKIPVGFPFDSK